MSFLFPLHLRGFGTYEVESISSYVHRAATLHCVSVNHLLRHSFAWHREKYGGITYHEYGACGTIAHLSRPNSSTADLVTVLSSATGEQNLRSGSLLAINGALDRAVRQFASHMRWCPSCMYEYKIADDPGYYKLVWNLSDISHCPEHRVALIDKCPECGSYQDGFGHKIMCRLCQKCGSSLGRHALYEDVVPSWKLKGLDLLDLVEKIAKEPSFTYPENGIKNLLSTIFDKAWDRQEEDLLWSKIPRDECLSLTCGNTTVSLKIARRFAARLGVKLHDLLLGEIDSLPGILEPEWFKDLPKEFRPRKRKSRHNRDEIFMKLLDYSSEKYDDEPLPLNQVAKLIGVSKGYLEYHHPEMCSSIVEKHRIWKQEKRLKMRHAARVEALKYFDIQDSTYTTLSRKNALRVIREKTRLPKNMLREEINAVYKLLF